jgi:hypothetical protein
MHETFQSGPDGAMRTMRHLRSRASAACISLLAGALPLPGLAQAQPAQRDTLVDLPRGKALEVVRVDDLGESELFVLGENFQRAEGRFSSFSSINGETTEKRQRFVRITTCAEPGDTVEARVIVVRDGDTLRHETWAIHVLPIVPEETLWYWEDARLSPHFEHAGGTSQNPAEGTLYLSSSDRKSAFAKNEVVSYSVTVLSKGKLRADWINQGVMLSPPAKAKLKRIRTGTLLVRDIVGSGPCDGPGEFHPPPPLHW